MNQLTKCITVIAGIVIVIAIFSVAYRWGRLTAPRASTVPVFRVNGPSMSPTFEDGDRCRIETGIAELQIGDVVAIRTPQGGRIKRVAALGGDVVDRAAGRLLINGRRLEDALALRRDDRFVPPGRVVVSTDQHRWRRNPDDSRWMIYTHRDPHQANRIAAVTDDYPINTTVRRILNPVDRLVLRVRPVNSQGPLDSETGDDTERMSVAFYDPQRAAVMTTTVNGLASHWSATKPANSPSTLIDAPSNAIDAAHPIAVAIDAQQARNYTFEVERDIEYRDDKPSGRIDYPVTLADDEVFVVGDNVPVSVDSRAFGPVKRSAIMGRVSAAIDVSVR